MYAREVGGELCEFGLELVVHDEDGELGALRVALSFGQSLEGALNVCLELVHGVADRRTRMTALAHGLASPKRW